MIQIDLPLPRCCSECVVRNNCIEYIYHDTEPFEDGCLIKRGKKEMKQFKNKTEQRYVIEVMNEILNYLASINYTFSDSDQFFIDYNILTNPEIFVFFLKNCKYTPDIDRYIKSKINELSKEEMINLYKGLVNSKETRLKDYILSTLNYDNYDYNTIIKDRDICINYDKTKYDSIIKLLNEIRNNDVKSNVILIMEHVDMNMVSEAYRLVGNNLKIIPKANQIGTNISEYSEIKYSPIYDYEHIKKSEEKLNLYASMVNDTKDKDGDIKSLSPLEKFVAAYILASKFAPYREVDKGEESYKSRSVYEFINSITNTKIVCVGYTHLLRELLYRMGIKDTIDWSVDTDNSKYNNTTDHMRMMVHLQDPKYNIDGIYMSDPTFDNREDTEKDFSHMLLSHDEAIKVDSPLDERKIRADNTSLMNSEFNITNSYELFRRPIPKDALIKAHLAVEHFLDKDMKMVKDGNYDLLEYVEMADKLKFYNVYGENREKVFDILQKMTLNEIEYNYSGLVSEFLHDVYDIINNRLIECGITDKLAGRYDEEKGQVLYGFRYQYANEEFPNRDITIEDISRLAELIPSHKIRKSYAEAEFYIEDFPRDKPVNMIIDEMVNKLIKLNELCKIITSNKDDNRLK